MITDNSIAIDASSSVVWDVYADVQRWSTWTPSIERIVPLDGPGIEPGHRFEIKQPRIPKLVWEVVAVAPGVSWTWRQRSPGGTTLAVHELVAQDDGSTVVHQQIDQRGPIGALVGRLMRRTTKRYLDLEGQGLKAAAEGRLDAPSA